MFVRSTPHGDSVHASSTSRSSSRTPPVSSSPRTVQRLAASKPSPGREPVSETCDAIQSPQRFLWEAESSPSQRAAISAPQEPACSQQSATMAQSRASSRSDTASPYDWPERLTSSTLPAEFSTASRSAAESAVNWQKNVTGLSHIGGLMAGSWRAGSHDGVVPLQANFKPCVTPRCTTMTAVATHIDDDGHIFIHEITNGG